MTRRAKDLEALAAAGEQFLRERYRQLVGAFRKLLFDPVRAQLFRLGITEATDVPTIWEFQLFSPKEQNGQK